MKAPMTLERYYGLTTTGMLSLSLVLAAISGAVLTPWTAVCALLAAAAALPMARRLLPVSGPLLKTLVGLGVGVGVYRLRATGDLVTLFATALAGAVPIAAWYRARPRGYWATLIVSFLLGLVCLIGGDGLAEHAVFLLLCATAVFHLNAGHLFLHVGAVEAGRQRLPQNYFASFLGSVGLGTAFGVALFVLFPRSFQWYNPLALRSRDAITGYSGHVLLDGTPLRESTEVAMIVESADPLWLARVGPRLHFRGNSLVEFDGVRWRNPKQPSSPLQGLDRVDHTARTERTPRRLTLYREPHATPAVLYPGVLRDIEAPLALLRGLFVDDGGNLRRGSTDMVRYKYEVTFLPTPFEGDVAPAAPLVPRRRAPNSPFAGTKALPLYRVLPDSLRSGFFSTWVGSVGARGGASLADEMRALEEHFRRNFRATYLLGAPPGEGVTTLERFLTTERAGHCEYFATAAALYLRARGFPTRLVLGYHGGVFNPVSSVLEVREANAHAWVEAFDPVSGWLGFDPTPLQVVPFADTLWNRARLRASAVKFWFQRYVVEYNTQTQRELIRDLIMLRRSGSGNRWWPKVSGRTVGMLLAAAVVIAWLARRRWRRKRAAAAWLPRYYRRFRERWRRAGFEKEPGESLAAFHARIDVDRAIVAEVDRAIERDLYSARPLSAEERRRLERESGR